MLAGGVSLLVRTDFLCFLEKKPASEGIEGYSVQVRPEMKNDCYRSGAPTEKEKEINY